MSEYVDLVICTHEHSGRYFLFQAPPWTHLKEDDEVLVDTARGQQHAYVKACETFDTNSDLYLFILQATKATLPLRRVLGKYTYRELVYTDDKGEENGTH